MKYIISLLMLMSWQSWAGIKLYHRSPRHYANLVVAELKEHFGLIESLIEVVPIYKPCMQQQVHEHELVLCLDKQAELIVLQKDLMKLNHK